MTRSLKVVFQRDFRTKGITWTRQHVRRKINNGTFPPPDGKTSDSPTAPNFWYETTIDDYLIERARAFTTQK